MNLITQKIVLPEHYSVPMESDQARDYMIAVSQQVQSVTNAAQFEEATASGSAIQKHLKEVEKTRLELARPLNEASKKLIDLERAYCAPLVIEKDRLGRLVTNFRQAEERRVAEEERKRQAEIQRLEQERIKSEQAAARAEAKGNEAKQLAAELKLHNATEAQMTVITAPLPTVAKSKGSATGRKLRYEVVDVKALYAARPELCNIEAKASAINAVCVATDGANELKPDTSVPGLKLWWESKTSFR